MKSILLIDSDPVTAKLTAKFLSNYGFIVTIAQEGKEALDRLNRPDFDLVLSDTRLRGLGGFDILKLMRRCYIDVPFGFLTSEDDSITRMEAESLGVSLFISKRMDYINLPHLVTRFFSQPEEMVA